MTETIKERIETIKKGELPEGYQKTKAGIIPEDWDGNVRAKQLFKSHTDKKHNGDLEILASTQERGIVPRSQIGIDIQCSDEGIKGYKKVAKGDFVISLRSFQGGIEYSEYDGIVSPAYTVLKPSGDISTGFYKSYFKTDSFIDRLNGAVYGIRDGKQIGYEDFGDMYVHCPPLAEQKRIAEILVQCDKVIELKQREIEELEKLKKAYLKMLFPKKECDQPELRFPGFSGIWKRRKLGEIGSVQTCKRIFKEQTSSDGEIPFYKNGTIGLQADAYISREVFEEFKRLYPYPEPGDILISAVGSVGRTAEYTGKDEYFQDSNVVWLKTDKMAVDKKFLKASYQVIDWLIEGSTVKHLYNDNILKSVIWIPETIEEQKAVGKFVEDFDYLITLHRDELAESKKKRKALAQLLLTGIVRTKNERPSF